MMKYFLVFAYGSLVNFSSAERTLQRPLDQSDVIAVWVKDYERVWDYKSTIHSATLEKDVTAIFLNLRSKQGAKVNGLVFRVSEEELDRLKKREANYDFTDITKLVDQDLGAPVYSFICTDAKILAGSDTSCVIMSKYIEMVKDGFSKQSEQFYQDYLKTTLPHSFDVVPGDYTFPPAK